MVTFQDTTVLRYPKLACKNGLRPFLFVFKTCKYGPMSLCRLLHTDGVLYGVYDGHGGCACAQAVKERLLTYIAVALLPVCRTRPFKISFALWVKAGKAKDTHKESNSFQTSSTHLLEIIC